MPRSSLKEKETRHDDGEKNTSKPQKATKTNQNQPKQKPQPNTTKGRRPIPHHPNSDAIYGPEFAAKVCQVSRMHGPASPLIWESQGVVLRIPAFLTCLTFRTEETLRWFFGFLFGWFLFGFGVACVLLPLIMLCFLSFNDDLGTPPTRRPHSWKKKESEEQAKPNKGASFHHHNCDHTATASSGKTWHLAFRQGLI